MTSLCNFLRREEIEKQKAKERYMKMHLAGKTDQAKADLARLAIIRKQREEAAKKKEEEKKGEEQELGNSIVSSLSRVTACSKCSFYEARTTMSKVFHDL